MATKFGRQVSTLRHQSTNFQLSNIGHILHQNKETFFSYSEFLVRFELQSHLGDKSLKTE